MKHQVILDNGDTLNIPQESITLAFQADGLGASLYSNIPPVQVTLAQFTFAGGRYVQTAVADVVAPDPAPEEQK